MINLSKGHSKIKKNNIIKKSTIIKIIILIFKHFIELVIDIVISFILSSVMI